MKISAIDAKYINIALAEALEEALKMRKAMLFEGKSPKQRAIYKALAEQASIRYNRLAQTIGYLGTSAIAEEAQTKRTIYPNKLEPMTTVEIDEIIASAYNVSEADRAQHRDKLKQIAEAQVLSVSYPKIIKDALETLAKHGKLHEFIDTDKFINKHVSNLPEYEGLPRGNPLKGGLVNKYMHKGFSKERANAQADWDIANGAYEQTQVKHENQALPQLDMTKPFIEGGLTPDEALAKIKANPSLLKLPKAGILASLEMSDSDFDSPKLIETNTEVEVSEGDRLLALLEE